MKFSIIIPTLNEEKLLPHLLEQLNREELRKSFDFEIVISDGGSKDKTIDIALKNSDVVVVHTKQEKQNIALGRNSGAKVASGEIFIFINADVLIPDIKYFFQYLEKNFVESEYLAMTCKVKVFPEEEILSDKLFHAGYNGYFHFLNSLGLGMGRGECQVIRKNIFENVSGYNEALAAGEDFDLFRRIRKLGKILFTTDVCVHESPRRFRKLGYSGVTFSWIKNGFSVLLKNKSISKEWEQVR
ncbi:MAG: glycosyltransferase [Ignavibacteriaceae bacterium]